MVVSIKLHAHGAAKSIPTRTAISQKQPTLLLQSCLSLFSRFLHISLTKFRHYGAQYRKKAEIARMEIHFYASYKNFMKYACLMQKTLAK